MKRKLLVIVVCAVILTFSFTFFVYAGKKEVKEEAPTIIFWQIEKGVGFAGWCQEVIDDINANEDFRVEMVEQPIGEVFNLITSAAVSQSGFDFLYEWAGEGNVIMRGKAGTYQPLNDLISKSVLANINPVTIQACTDSDGKLWGLPFLNDLKYLAYNKRMLKEAGIDVSKMTNSWKDFTSMCEKVKQAGMVPITWANKEGYGCELWCLNNMYQYFDETQELIDFFVKGENFNDPRLKDAADKYKYLYKKGYLWPGGETADYASYYFPMFSSEKAAFIWMMNSKWYTVVRQGEIAEDNVGYMKLPLFGNARLANVMPTLDYVFAMAKWTKYPEETAKALSYFVNEKWMKRLFTGYNQTVAYKGLKVEDTSELTIPQKMFLEQKELTIIGYEAVKDTAMQYETFNRGLTQYSKDEITFEEFAQQLYVVTHQD
jgi:ABC-type glycerol-3-phosphate transport system substrate-binding protein